MSLLLDALKNAENIDNKSSVDKQGTAQETLVAECSHEKVDQEPLSEIDLEAPALAPPNKENEPLDENMQQDTVLLDSIGNSQQETDEKTLIAAQRHGLSHKISSVESVTHTTSDNQRRKTDAHQTPINSDSAMRWDLPSHLTSNTSAEKFTPEKKRSSTATNSAVIEPEKQAPEKQINNPSPVVAQEVSDQPQFFHYSKPINHSNHKAILVTIFILIGTAAGTILLFMLNQLESQASLFSRPNASSQTSVKQADSQPVALATNVTNVTNVTKTNLTDAHKAHVTAGTTTIPNKILNTTLPKGKKRTTQQIDHKLLAKNKNKNKNKNKERLSSLDPVIAITKNRPQQITPAVSNDPGTVNTQNIATNSNSLPRTNVIRIIKHKISVSNNSYLMEAYRYYQQRQYSQALLLYKKVLRNNNKSRDALLGLAAIAIRQSQLPQAVSYYKTLLNLDPKDQLALGGLISLKQHQNPNATVSFINQLIKQKPSAYLFFLLGNIYSSNKSWPEAQSAYFKAWNADNAKPDYAFNLAISLDSLKQHSSALHYYQIALRLSNTNTAGFNRRLLIQRIRDLSHTQSGSKQ